MGITPIPSIPELNGLSSSCVTLTYRNKFTWLRDIISVKSVGYRYLQGRAFLSGMQQAFLFIIDSLLGLISGMYWNQINKKPLSYISYASSFKSEETSYAKEIDEDQNFCVLDLSWGFRLQLSFYCSGWVVLTLSVFFSLSIRSK